MSLLSSNLYNSGVKYMLGFITSSPSVNNLYKMYYICFLPQRLSFLSGDYD